jgi:XTP/dITP diphosphohydrolase
LFDLKGKIILFATGNASKFNEARRLLAEYNISVGMLKVKSLEIQSENLDEISESSVIEAFGKVRLPMIVEDAGLFIDALNGFPGPYAAYVYKTIGNEGLLKLMIGISERKAKFRSSIAYLESGLAMPHCFDGEVQGEITLEPRTSRDGGGFGFDPVFMPAGIRKTFSEMSLDEKNRFSHRASALRQFGEWYRKQSRR